MQLAVREVAGASHSFALDQAAPLLVKCGANLGCGGCRGMLLWRRRFRFFPAHTDEFRDAGLLHRYAVKHTAHLHGLAVVRDDRLEERRVGKECRSGWSRYD